MIRKFGGTTGIDIQPTGLDLGLGGGSNIKSIQRGTATITSANTNITISAIDVTKSIIIVSTSETSADTVNKVCVKAAITNSTTINLNLQNWGHNLNVAWQVIEFNNVKSKQTGDILITSASTTVTISNINTSKSLLLFSNDSQYAGDANVENAIVCGAITNSTTLTFLQSMVSAVSKNVAWQVIEFN